MGASTNWEFQSIPIDFEVFKGLTAQLESPSDTYNGVLRRLLRLPERPAEEHTQAQVARRPWVVDGVVFPHGTEFRGRYKGRVYPAKVDDGALLLNGQRYSSPSPAAMAITRNSVNGWLFWECRRPGHTGWTRIDGLRGK